ncbi:hypothetical protein [Nocardioides daphniae]|uniref:GNAT family N-acetyltransferase n=1 Tax=Nocardioides daphniae TaxID=402297 RepID=A0A4P7UAA6_9ACTN|nr:hypothetical protein [Nocardioides daphniae]QCC77032.1 hypothetical protein E2C04_07040 [Nocardioides daphniae]
MTLRPATRDDLAAMVEVHLAARAAAPMPPAAGGRDVVREGLASADEDELWVAEAELATGAAVVAYVRFVRPTPGGWAGSTTCTSLPGPRDRVRTALLDLVKAALPDGFGLWAFASNRPARVFYADRGLVEVEQVAAHESPTGEAEVRLEWAGSPGG